MSAAALQPVNPADRSGTIEALRHHFGPSRNIIPLPERDTPPTWSQQALAGRLCELSSPEGQGQLSLALQLVLDTQLEGGLAAWISARESLFFAPDALENGIDLDALPVIQVAHAQDAGRAADKLLRSEAFALIVLDLGAAAILPLPLQARLVQLARRAPTALLCLTHKSEQEGSLGSLVSLRAQAFCRRLDARRFVCGADVIKDKQAGPGWRFTEVFDGPSGLH